MIADRETSTKKLFWVASAQMDSVCSALNRIFADSTKGVFQFWFLEKRYRISFVVATEFPSFSANNVGFLDDLVHALFKFYEVDFAVVKKSASNPAPLDLRFIDETFGLNREA